MNFDIDDSIAVLTRTPGTFRAALAGLPDVWITADERPETFEDVGPWRQYLPVLDR